MQISEIQQKMEKKVFVSGIFAIELDDVNSHYYKKYTCHQQSMC